jgi:hypothetical protein
MLSQLGRRRKKLRQLRDIGGKPSRLILAEQLGCGSSGADPIKEILSSQTVELFLACLVIRGIAAGRERAGTRALGGSEVIPSQPFAVIREG